MTKILLSSPDQPFKSYILGVLHVFIGFCLISIGHINFFIPLLDFFMPLSYVGFIYICTKGFKGWCKLKFVSQLSAFFSFLYLFGAFSGLKVFIGDCWVLFSNVGSYSLFPKFRMIYHCVFLRFLFVACRCSTKFII